MVLRECVATAGGASGVPDNLGNHTATQNINLAGFGIYNTSGVNIDTNWDIHQSGTSLSFDRTGTRHAAITTGGTAILRAPSLDNAINNVLVWDSGTAGGTVKRRTASTIETNTTLVLTHSGSATGADPYTTSRLVYTNESGTITQIDYRDTIYFEQGQAGGIIVDGPMDEQPRFIVPSGFQIELNSVYVTLGKAGTTDTTLQFNYANDPGDGSAPVQGSADSTLLIPADDVYTKWPALAGVVLNSEQHVQTRVNLAGSGAQSLVIHFWGKTTR